MPTVLSKTSLATLRKSTGGLQADEAIALLVEVGERLRWRHAPPAVESICLWEDGTVEFLSAPGPLATAAPYAQFLHALLPEPEAGRPGKVPGRVRILVARALGQTTLPPLVSAEEFGTRLKTVAPDRPSLVLAGLVARSRSLEESPHAAGDPVHPSEVPLAERQTVQIDSPRRSEARYPAPIAWDEVTWEGRSASRSQSGTPHPDRQLAGSTTHGDRRHVLPAVGRRVSRDNWTRVITIVGLLVLGMTGFTLGRFAGARAMRAPQRSDDATSRSASRLDRPGADGPITAESAARAPAATANERGSGTGRMTVATPGVQRGLVPVAVREGQTYSPSFGSTADTLFFHAEYTRGTRLMEAHTDTDGRPIAMEVLLTDEAHNYHVRMSPDGGRLAYDSDRDGVRGVYIKPVTGATPERVSGARYAAVPVWAPDGRRLAFVRAEADRPRVWNLWMADLPSGSQRRLTNHRVGQVWPGNWFKDGRRLVYTHETHVWVLDTASGKGRSYEAPIAGRLLRTAAVSSNGQRVAFQVYRDGLWVLDLSTGQMTRWLADASAEEFAWSPDDSRLAFHSRRGGRWQVWTMAAPTN